MGIIPLSFIYIPGFNTVTYVVSQFYAGSQLIENEDDGDNF